MLKNVSRYKVCTNGKHGIREDRSHCRLQISMGIERHTGDKFAALCEWANRRFDRTTIIVSDSLQRHNLRYDNACGEEEAHYQALMIGDKWLSDNKEALSLISDLSITRWDDWLSHPDFPRNHNELWKRYKTNREFKRSINIRINYMWHRKNLNNSDRFSIERKAAYFSNSLNYLMEELALFPIMFEEKAIDVYAGSWFYDLFQTMIPIVSSPISKSLEQATCYEVDFERKKQFVA